MIEIKDGIGASVNIGDTVVWRRSWGKFRKGTVRKIIITQWGKSFIVQPEAPAWKGANNYRIRVQHFVKVGY